LVVPDASGAITIARDVNMSSTKLTVKDFEVMGTMTTKHAEEVQIGDSNMLLNAFHGLDSDQDAGIVVKCKRMGSIATATAISAEGQFTTSNADVFADGDILSVVAVDGEGNAIAHDANGLYAADAGCTASLIKVKDASVVAFCNKQEKAKPVAQAFHVYKVMVHHLKFHMVAAHDSGAMSTGGTVSYGHGSTLSHFTQDYGYRDMMMGDIHSSVGSIVASGASVTKSITKFSGNNDNDTIKLPASPVEGATYRIFNIGSTQVQVTDNGGGHTNLPKLNANGRSSFTFIKTSLAPDGEWVEHV